MTTDYVHQSGHRRARAWAGGAPQKGESDDLATMGRGAGRHVANGRAGNAMRFAYADPPYPGQAHKYRGHKDYAGEVDHAKLIGQLEHDYPDGWALSTSQAALQQVLAACPVCVRIAVWHVTNSTPFGFGSNWWLSWEPVIVRGGRLDSQRVKNVLTCAAPTGFLGNALPGQKPAVFTRWMLALLGATPDDVIDDLFPGSGAVGIAIESWRAQPVLGDWQQSSAEKPRRKARARIDRASGHPVLDL